MEWVVGRKVSRDELFRRGIVVVGQLAALPLEEIQSVAGIGEKNTPRIKALAQCCNYPNKMECVSLDL